MNYDQKQDGRASVAKLEGNQHIQQQDMIEINQKEEARVCKMIDHQFLFKFQFLL